MSVFVSFVCLCRSHLVALALPVLLSPPCTIRQAILPTSRPLLRRASPPFQSARLTKPPRPASPPTAPRFLFDLSSIIACPPSFSLRFRISLLQPIVRANARRRYPIGHHPLVLVSGCRGAETAKSIPWDCCFCLQRLRVSGSYTTNHFLPVILSNRLGLSRGQSNLPIRQSINRGPTVQAVVDRTPR